MDRELLSKTDVQLDLFGVSFKCNYYSMSSFKVNEIVDFLKTLYEHGFYKVLRASFDGASMYHEYMSTLPGLEILDIEKLDIDLSPLINLKELNINYIDNNIDLETLAKSLTKLKRLRFCSVSPDEVLPFICHSKRLELIYIQDSYCFEIDLILWNEKRKMLENARPVLICVKEDQYLATKWRPQYFNLSHVKISRRGSKYFQRFRLN